MKYLNRPPLLDDLDPPLLLKQVLLSAKYLGRRRSWWIRNRMEDGLVSTCAMYTVYCPYSLSVRLRLQ